MAERQQEAPGGEKYETQEWILKGFGWEALPTIEKVFEEFNAQFGTDFEFQLKSMATEEQGN